eukprot:6034854-Prymnesium_polylepis.1
MVGGRPLPCLPPLAPIIAPPRPSARQQLFGGGGGDGQASPQMAEYPTAAGGAVTLPFGTGPNMGGGPNMGVGRVNTWDGGGRPR